ncbi:syntaxin-7-like isoform X1 [Mytilus trossulus]
MIQAMHHIKMESKVSSTREYRDDPGYAPYKDGKQEGRFSDLCREISGNISTINNGANALDRAMKIINTERDSPQIRDRIHDTSQSTNRIVVDTTKLMKKVAGIKGLDRSQKLQIDRLKSDFQDSVQRFSSLQKKAAEKVKQTTKLSEKKPKSSAGWLDEDDDKSPFVEQERRREEMQAQEQVIEDDLALIQDREERIRQLEGDILDVNEIFRDLGALIHEQGGQIDSIEANVEQAYSNVEQGTSQLGKAADYQRKSRKKMCCLLIILLIVAAIITLIIILATK